MFRDERDPPGLTPGLSATLRAVAQRGRDRARARAFSVRLHQWVGLVGAGGRGWFRWRLLLLPHDGVSLLFVRIGGEMRQEQLPH
ncbi:hypothetical protein ASF42_06865 [Rathayibacter sp. Leaf294]|nr:hypothetical protein ASF42_06865 [Rathayibacter sp. Leaf294]